MTATSTKVRIVIEGIITSIARFLQIEPPMIEFVGPSGLIKPLLG